MPGGGWSEGALPRLRVGQYPFRRRPHERPQDVGAFCHCCRCMQLIRPVDARAAAPIVVTHALQEGVGHRRHWPPEAEGAETGLDLTHSCLSAFWTVGRTAPLRPHARPTRRGMGTLFDSGKVFGTVGLHLSCMIEVHET